MKVKHKISDVLWLAANRFLAKNDSWSEIEKGKNVYSCCAVENASYELCQSSNYPHVEKDKLDNRTRKFLQRMGVDCDSVEQFKEFECPPGSEEYHQNCWYPTPKSQGARYAWLMFAYERALEEENE